MASAGDEGPRTGLAVARVGIALLLLGVTLVILRPFLVPAVWAAVVAFMTWRPYTRLRDRTGRPQAAALLFTLAIALVAGVPAVWLLVSVIEESVELIRAGQEWAHAGAPLPRWLVELPGIGAPIANLFEEGVTVETDLAPKLLSLGTSLTQQVLGVAGGVAGNLFAFFVTITTLFVLYVEGDRVVEHARRVLAFLFPNRPASYLDSVGSIVRGVVLGILGTAAIQGAVAGVGYAIFGVPYVVGLSGLTALVSFLPGGTLMAWGGATVWLATQGDTGAAIGMALWGAILVGSLDNFLRPFLIKRAGSGDIPFLLVLFGVLGGLAAFGLLGLLFGPVVLAVSFALITEVPPRERGSAPADTAEAVPPAPQRTK